MKKDLLDLTLEEVKEFAAELGERPYRGKQLFSWIYRDRPPAVKEGSGDSFEEINVLPAAFREKLNSCASLGNVKAIRSMEDPKDGTRKFLFEADKVKVEGVFMKYRYGNTMCISSQAGCRMGCRFCASALGGFVRDLTAGEMVGQVLKAERETSEKINHIVVMGMGEPFDNYDALGRFLRIMHEPEGRKMSWRNMTVSTSGIVPMIDRFAEDFPQVNLAISLHRADDEMRSDLMPVNRKYPIGELMRAARRYTEKTHRRITFEYALIEGENDREEDWKKLTELLKGMLCHVNLIPLNEVDEIGLKGSGEKRAEAFRRGLEVAGIPVTMRRKLGTSIDGACGQLRLRST